jgi:hypothetical protein
VFAAGRKVGAQLWQKNEILQMTLSRIAQKTSLREDIKNGGAKTPPCGFAPL